jgi:hypothetical protein
MALKIMSLVKSNNKERKFIVWTKLPDGLNYFQGIHEVRLPTAHGTAMPMLMNLWTIHFDDLKNHAGIFTKDEAEFYLKNMGMDGCHICTVAEMVAIRKSEQN